MTPELWGLIATLRRGSPRWLAFTVDRNRAAYALPPGENHATPIGSVGGGRRRCYPTVLTSLPRSGRGPILRSRLRTQSPYLLVRPVSIAVPVCGAQRAPNTSTGSVGDRALDDEIDSPTHQRRRRSLEEINSVSSNSPSSEPPLPLRASGEGTSQVDPSACLPDVQETSSWIFSYDDEVPILENPEGVASIWRKIREKGCELPSLDNMRERDIYVRMAIVNAKVMEQEEVGNHLLTIQQLRGELETVRATEKQREVEVEGLKGKLVAAEAEKVALQTDLDLMKEKHRRDIEGCKATALKERSLARRSLAQEYDAEVRARIAALAEYSEGGFELDEELERLKDREISLDLDYGVASVSDPSLSRLDLP
ncbi:hypothetical protein HID58_047064 [Brassica napus]|uniref:Uncharacterized protein n=1 Tax=Brassica napus TaxID=3708 RepID=A0ABQ8AY42_BRANA|nr:hypothetical protein HID58_047064 [Brassica napus]